MQTHTSWAWYCAFIIQKLLGKVKGRAERILGNSQTSSLAYDGENNKKGALLSSPPQGGKVRTVCPVTFMSWYTHSHIQTLTHTIHKPHKQINKIKNKNCHIYTDPASLWNSDALIAQGFPHFYVATTCFAVVFALPIVHSSRASPGSYDNSCPVSYSQPILFTESSSWVCRHLRLLALDSET